MNMFLIDSAIDGVMWTLQVEICALPAILMSYFSYRVWGLKGPLIIALTLTIMSFIHSWNHLLQVFPGVSLVEWLYAFSFGATAFHISMRSKLSVRSHAIIGGISISTLFLFPAFGGHGQFPAILLPISQPNQRVTTLITAVAASATIFTLASGHLRSVSRFLRLRLFHFLGKISFSLYLLHPLTLLIFWKMPATLGSIVEAGVPSALVAFVLWPISVAIIAPVAWISYRFVEVPGQRLGNLIRKWITHNVVGAREPLTSAR